jgi:hypothetical protein
MAAFPDHLRPYGRFPRRLPADHPRRKHRAAHPRPAKRASSRWKTSASTTNSCTTAEADDRPPEGIILVTGPTGSGKTTTLYSVLNHINAEGINIMTLEDPVEYPMAMIRQTSVAEAAKLDFANGIRSMMRQDPDVILVGEIRDAETAEMAFRAAMTGHQVYSTLHTNSAIGAIPRLLDIGVLPDILAGNIIGIVAQRLIRRLCDRTASRPTMPSRTSAICSAHGRPADPAHVLYRPRLRTLRLPGLPRTHRDHGDAAHGWGPRRTDRTPRHHPRHPQRRHLQGLPSRWPTTACAGSSTARPRWKKSARVVDLTDRM